MIRRLDRRSLGAALLLAPALALPAAPDADKARGISRRPLRFPRDFGAHPDTGLEWWYLTGLLSAAESAAEAAPLFGCQLTFFRLRNPDAVVQQHPSTLAPRQLLLGHVALSDLRAGAQPVLRHGQRLARVGAGASAALADCALQLRDWRLLRAGPTDASRYVAQLGGDDFALSLELQAPQPPLLQGQAGFSRAG